MPSREGGTQTMGGRDRVVVMIRRAVGGLQNRTCDRRARMLGSARRLSDD